MRLPERLSNDQLPAFAFPGGYPIVYYTADGGELCPKCANEFTPERDNAEQLQPVECDVHYEGAPIVCEHCNAEIESACGDPEENA